MNNINFSITYNPDYHIVFVKLINKNIDLNHPTEHLKTTEIIRNLLVENKCNRIFSDTSLTFIRLSYDVELHILQNFNKIYNYPNNTFLANYKGEFYDEVNYVHLRKVLKDNDVTNIEFFGDFDEALEWLLSK